jgi:hypothetical protein
MQKISKKNQKYLKQISFLSEISSMKKSFIEIGSSETLRAVCSEKISNINTSAKGKTLSTLQFSYWLAGLIDGDGSLLCSNKGYTSCEITLGEKEYNVLQFVKDRMGGSIKLRTKAKAYRWRLNNKEGMLQLVKYINGKLHLAERQCQLKRVCAFLQLEYSFVKKISERTGWVAGFYEAVGYFHLNRSTLQCSITLAQKDLLLLQEINAVLPGTIYYEKSWDGWVYSASKYSDVSRWVHYFSLFPLRSWKQIQLQRFKRILLYKSRGLHLSESVRGRPWKRLKRLVEEFSGKSQKKTVHTSITEFSSIC